MLKILLISLIGVASAVNFLDFGNGLKKLTHNRIVEHFGVDAVDKGKVEALPVEDKIKSVLKKIDSLFNQVCISKNFWCCCSMKYENL